MSNREEYASNLAQMGFDSAYITRALKVFENNYGQEYDLDVLTEIIVRLKQKDEEKNKGASTSSSAPSKSSQQAPSQPPQQPYHQQQYQQYQYQQQYPPHQQHQQISQPQQQHQQNPSKQSSTSSKSQQKQSIDGMKGMNNEIQAVNDYGISQNINRGITNNSVVSVSASASTSMPKSGIGKNTVHPQIPETQTFSKSPMTTPSPSQSYSYTYTPQPNSSAGPSPQAHPPAHSSVPSQHQNQNQQYASTGLSNKKESWPITQQQNDNTRKNSNEKREETINEETVNYKLHSGGDETSSFNIGDKVYYKTFQGKVEIAEIVAIEKSSNGAKIIEITYPLSKSLEDRETQFVGTRQIQKVESKAVDRKSSESKPSEVKPLESKPVEIKTESKSQGKSRKTSEEVPTSQEKSLKTIKSPQAGSKKSLLIPEFVPHMTLEEAENLRLHDRIDHRDEVGRYLEASIVEKLGSTLKIHYEGWGRKWDCYSDYREELHRFAKFGSISQRPANRFKQLKKGDFVDINPKMRHEGWVVGEIRKKDKKSGQVQVVYEKQGKNYLFWAHLDDKESIAEFTTKSNNVSKPQVDIEPQLQQKESIQPYENFIYDDLDVDLTYPLWRAQQFPKMDDEIIDNKYMIGDWVEIQDIRSGYWIPANIIDKENNWIVIHFDGYSDKYDQSLHVIKMKHLLRDLGDGLEPDAIDLEIKEEMENFIKRLKEWKWELLTIQADGNCLYRSFAHEIYGDQNEHMKVRQECIEYMQENREFFENFILDWDETLVQKSQEYEWGDHVDINAMSELYNVRVQVYELNKDTNKLYMSYDQGGMHESTQQLPVVLLARHRGKHYNIIKSPEEYNRIPRPLRTAIERRDTASIRAVRLQEEEETAPETKEDEDGEEDDPKDENNKNNKNNNNKKEKGNDDIGNEKKRNNEMTSFYSNIGIMDRSSQFSLRGLSKRQLSSPLSSKSLFPVQLQAEDLTHIVEKTLKKSSKTLTPSDIEKIFGYCLERFYQKIRQKWEQEHPTIPIEVLENYYRGRYSSNAKAEVQRFINQLREKTQSQIFDFQVVLLTFNSNVVGPFAENLTSLVKNQYSNSPEKI